jgi:hypothetical protein
MGQGWRGYSGYCSLAYVVQVILLDKNWLKDEVVRVLNLLSATPGRRMRSECIDPHCLYLDTS